MKRLHVSIGTADLDESVRFYKALFGIEPTVLKDDYAKWMLDDPRVNFAVTTKEGGQGVAHLGIQAESPAELEELFGRVAATGAAVFDEGETTCCYAQSKKQWVDDPQGVTWEHFLTHGESETFGQVPERPAAAPCCDAAS